MLEVITEIISQYGVPFGLVIAFIWRDYEREKVMNARTSLLESKIGCLEKETRTILIDLVNRTSNIVSANNILIKDLIEIFKLRPCLADTYIRKILDRVSGDGKDSKLEIDLEFIEKEIK